MGTSQSSGGPGAGVPMIPPWVPDAEPEREPSDGNTNSAEPEEGELPAAVPVAPAARFNTTRRALGRFAATGERAQMRRAIGKYVAEGYGGARTFAQRMGGSASTAAALFGVLSHAAGSASAAERSFDAAALAGRSSREVTDAVLEAVRPIDGTQDAEASRVAIRKALSELLDRFPEADLSQLTAEQCSFVVEVYVALDVYNRFILDVGQHIRTSAPTAHAELSRLTEIQDYIRQTVDASFRKVGRGEGNGLRVTQIDGIVRRALRNAFDVFASYSE